MHRRIWIEAYLVLPESSLCLAKAYHREKALKVSARRKLARGLVSQKRGSVHQCCRILQLSR